uniref:Uncharacterized protein n=1 Tax=Arundo donax TaxID=35708 RepID=A0A0A9GY55_ARUDO
MHRGRSPLTHLFHVAKWKELAIIYVEKLMCNIFAQSFAITILC